MKRCAEPATRLFSGAPALRRFESPSMGFGGSPVSEKNPSRQVVHNCVAYTLIFPVLSLLLAVLALSLTPRRPWLDPRLPWLALRLPWPVVLCALQRARLVYGKDQKDHQKDQKVR